MQYSEVWQRKRLGKEGDVGGMFGFERRMRVSGWSIVFMMLDRDGTVNIGMLDDA